MLSEFFKIPIRIQEAASFFIYQIPTWAVWNLFEELLMWFHRFEFSALINLVLSRPVSSQGYTRAWVRSLRKFKAGMSKQHKQKKEFYRTKVWRWLLSKIKMAVSKVLWSVCEEFAKIDREFLDFASSNEVSFTNKIHNCFYNALIMK